MLDAIDVENLVVCGLANHWLFYRRRDRVVQYRERIAFFEICDNSTDTKPLKNVWKIKVKSDASQLAALASIFYW